MNFYRIVCAKNLLGNASAVEYCTGTYLPCHTVDVTLVCTNLHGVFGHLVLDFCINIIEREQELRAFFDVLAHKKAFQGKNIRAFTARRKS